jgi:hypothetical protein
MSGQEHMRLRPSGGYRKLRSFQTATIIYDATVSFCDRFIDKRSRTIDQMVQAARSGRQNIAEGSRAAATSSQTELRSHILSAADLWRFAPRARGRTRARSSGAVPIIRSARVRRSRTDPSDPTERAEVICDQHRLAETRRCEKNCALKQGMMQELLTGRIRLVGKSA